MYVLHENHKISSIGKIRELSESFASTTNFLKRRFSSGDLSGEGFDDELEGERQSSGVQTNTDSNPVPTHSVSQSSDLTLNFRGSNTTSAPTSPHHSGVSSFLSRATSLTGSVTSTVQQIARTATNKDRQKILLVIDDHQTDWSKYFRGKRLQGEWDIRVEQAEFRDLTLASSSESGSVVSIIGFDRSGSKVARSFRPDFVLIRQHIRDVREDYRDILLGLAFGNVKTLPTCHQG
ncbi:unnamed protein product [Medioppia subpectinata]|uniref:Synapsin pre-ATP-grasp domain-containing protein n=1 Tax=Medioppia subpectinata TaxID=1979941 RepID=A0A7R9KI23_9ACAR|nr:unnamed protein product [Medioppia subpectinata]CAG2103905.1 unnamed protein product [Medioppia subpectinata]